MTRHCQNKWSMRATKKNERESVRKCLRDTHNALSPSTCNSREMIVCNLYSVNLFSILSIIFNKEIQGTVFGVFFSFFLIRLHTHSFIRSLSEQMYQR